MSSIAQDSSRGLLPELNKQHLERIRRHIKNAMDIQCLEILQDRNTVPRNKRSRRMMESTTPDPSPSLLTMATPIPVEPKFFPRDHDCSATFNKPESCPEGVIGQLASSAPDSGLPSARVAATSSSLSPWKTSDIRQAEAPEDWPMLQEPSSLSKEPSRSLYSVSSANDELKATSQEGDLLSTTDDLGPLTDTENLDFYPTTPWDYDLLHHSWDSNEQQ